MTLKPVGVILKIVFLALSEWCLPGILVIFFDTMRIITESEGWYRRENTDVWIKTVL